MSLYIRDEVIIVGKSKKKKKASLCKIRIFFAIIIFGTITCCLGYNLFSNLINIKKMKEEKKELTVKIVDLKQEKEILESDILRLNDPDYIAKYVREKYYYSKEGEVILRMDD